MGMGERRFRAQQIAHWLHSSGISSIKEMANLPTSLREALSKEWCIDQLNEEAMQESSDGTVKWLFRTADDHLIETVLIPADDRNSLCVSTQVGCAMGCHFCRTAKLGFKRNLESGEILDQFVMAQRWLRLYRPQSGELTNIVFMGMGEPMMNLNEVEKAIHWLHHPAHYNISRRRITVSTSGVVPGIEEFARRNIPAKLAISLNGSNQETRAASMPVARRWPLDQLLKAVDNYIHATNEMVTFEYVLIKGSTCSEQAALELGEIVRNRRCKINAIPLNPSEFNSLQQPTTDEIEQFCSYISSVGKQITLRQPRGREINAACGQLAANHQEVLSC